MKKRMRPWWPGAAALLAASALAAEPLSYDAWRAAHPDLESEIAALKARTAELVSRAGVLAPAPDDPNQPVIPIPAAPDPRADLPPVILAVPGAIADILDCADVCPEMVVIPAGEFTQGAPAAETGRTADEVQLRRSFDRAFAVARYEVTRGQYAAFAADTGRTAGGGCPTDRKGTGTWAEDPAGTWKDPGFPQTDADPVVCVSFDDAAAYAAWLSLRTGKPYRLLSEAEFEYAARAGTTTAFPWGEAPEAACGFANGRDARFRALYPADKAAMACDDGFAFTAPVGRYPANGFGLHDLIGNAWEWTTTCIGGCIRRVQRGGGWGAGATDLRPAQRVAVLAETRDASTGFRVARDL